MRSLFALGLLPVVLASLFSSGPDIDVKASFREGVGEKVFNGLQNTLLLSISNHESSDFVLETVFGSFKEIGGKEKPVRNSTHQKFSSVIPAKNEKPLVVAYQFYTQLKPQELGLIVWADFSSTDKSAKRPKKVVHQVVAYDGQVTIAEAPSSFFDLQLLMSYLMLIGLIGGGGYLFWPTLQSWLGIKTSKSKRGKRGPRPSAVQTPQKSAPGAFNTPGGASAAAGSPTKASYDADWLPAHHTAKAKTTARDALSGSEAEGTDSSAGRAKKRRAR